MRTNQFLAISGLILLAALSRLLPHPFNFTPIGAIALFSGTRFRNEKYVAFLMPLAAMLLSDLILGYHSTLPFVYGCFGVMVLMGFWIGEKSSINRIAMTTLSGSALFFLVTNFAHWVLENDYSKNLAGLIECYAAALPFFHRTILGDLFYTGVLFGSWALIHRYVFKSSSQQLVA